MYKHVKRWIAALFASCLFIIPAMPVYADSYDVNAVVEAPLPPDLPVITTEPNTTVGEPTIEVTGTCIVIVPHLVVVLLRDDQTIGSGVCTDQGTFQITVPLVLGVNIIRVKFMTVTGQSGGFGESLTVTYDPSQTSDSPTTTDTTPDNTTPNTTDQASLGNLFIKFDYDFITYVTDKETAVTLSVGGGNPPYKLFVGWGDGSSKVLDIEKPDTFVVKHLYRTLKSSSNKIVLRVVDSKGKSVEVERALITLRTSAGDVAAQPSLTNKSDNAKMLGIWFTTTVGVTLAATLSYNAYFGAHSSSNAIKKVRLSKSRVRTGRRG